MLCSSSFLFDTFAVIRTAACTRMGMTSVRVCQGWIRMDAEQDVKWKWPNGSSNIFLQIAVHISRFHPLQEFPSLSCIDQLVIVKLLEPLISFSIPSALSLV